MSDEQKKREHYEAVEKALRDAFAATNLEFSQMTEEERNAQLAELKASKRASVSNHREGENCVTRWSRMMLAFNIERDAKNAADNGGRGKTYEEIISTEELEQVYADTVAAYRPILEAFLIDLIRRTGAPADDLAQTIVDAIPRLEAALPDEICAPAVAAAWNAAPFPLGVEGADARCRVWLFANSGRFTGGKLYARTEDNKPHPLARDG